MSAMLGYIGSSLGFDVGQVQDTLKLLKKVPLLRRELAQYAWYTARMLRLI